MTQEQALAEAVKRYGPTAYATIGRTNQCDIGIDITHYKKGWDPKKFGQLKLLLGWGSTWEEALELARERVKAKLNERTSEHTAQTSKNPTQLRLFP